MTTRSMHLSAASYIIIVILIKSHSAKSHSRYQSSMCYYTFHFHSSQLHKEQLWMFLATLCHKILFTNYCCTYNVLRSQIYLRWVVEAVSVSNRRRLVSMVTRAWLVNVMVGDSCLIAVISADDLTEHSRLTSQDDDQPTRWRWGCHFSELELDPTGSRPKTNRKSFECTSGS